MNDPSNIQKESKQPWRRFALIAMGAAMVFCYLATVYKFFGPRSTSPLFYILFYGMPLVWCAFITLSRKDPLAFLLIVIVFLLPFIGIFLPPRRFIYSFLHVIGWMIGILILVYKVTGKERIRFFPTSAAWIPLLFIIPSVMTSIVIITSLRTFLFISSYYFIFVAYNHYMQKKGWVDRIILGLSVSLIIASLMVYIHHFTGIDPSLTRHAREFGTFGGMLVHRSSGVFQDPQKAAQFLGVFLVFFLILILQKCTANKLYRRLFIFAVILSSFALLLTVSRAAIFSTTLVALFAIMFLNRYSIPIKTLIISFSVSTILAVALLSGGLFKSIMPASLAARTDAAAGVQGRMDIWKSTWYMFENNPITGIGPGGYRTYLVQTNPEMRARDRKGRRVPIMPESGYLKILYETGIVGLAGCIYLLIAFLVFSLKRLLTLKFISGKALTIAASAAMLVFLSSFTTNFTIHDSRDAMIPIFLFLFIKNSYSISL